MNLEATGTKTKEFWKQVDKPVLGCTAAIALALGIFATKAHDAIKQDDRIYIATEDENKRINAAAIANGTKEQTGIEWNKCADPLRQYTIAVNNGRADTGMLNGVRREQTQKFLDCLKKIDPSAFAKKQSSK